MFKLFKKKNEDAVKADTIEQSIHEQMAEAQTVLPDTEDMDEIIAVITAAVAASLNRSTHNIIVRSVRRVPTVSPAWNRAARIDLTTPKLF